MVQPLGGDLPVSDTNSRTHDPRVGVGIVDAGSVTDVVAKATHSDLAFFGGTPAFQQKQHVGRPNIGSRRRFLERINDMLDRRWLTNNGPFAQEFEQRIASLVGVKHCIAVCNATVGLEIAIRALGLAGEVIVPSFTFIATAHALQWQEITPVFCDVEPDFHTIDPEKIERLITPRTTGIIGVHTWGNPCSIDALTEIAKRHDLKLLFDAAHAFGCSHKCQLVGGNGDAEVFSFHATKFANALEGGAVVTNDDRIAEKVRLMTNFGFTNYDTVDYVGTNGKMNEACAAMGLTSLESLDYFVQVNRRNYGLFMNKLGGIAGIRLLPVDASEQRNFQYVVVEVDEQASGISRDQLYQILWAENILARRYFYPGCHRMEPYRSYFPNAGVLLPETEKLVQRVLVLPTGTAIGETEITAICKIIRLCVEHGAEISSLLAGIEAASP